MNCVLALILCAMLPAHEEQMINAVAKEYGLDAKRTLLLSAIRLHENGRAGLEFGIGGPMDSGHPAHRYRDGRLSFYLQAQWAAGTIKKRYNGNLMDFARRYCPKNSWRWYVGVSSLMYRLQQERNN